MVDKPNTTPIGQDRETLTFKALLYLNAAAHVQVCILFCMVYIPLLSLVQLGFPAIMNIFVVNQIICYNMVFTITKTQYNKLFFRTVTLCYSGVPLQYSIYTRTGALNRMGALTSTGALIKKTHLKDCLLEGGH